MILWCLCFLWFATEPNKCPGFLIMPLGNTHFFFIGHWSDSGRIQGPGGRASASQGLPFTSQFMSVSKLYCLVTDTCAQANNPVSLHGVKPETAGSLPGSTTIHRHLLHTETIVLTWSWYTAQFFVSVFSYDYFCAVLWSLTGFAQRIVSVVFLRGDRRLKDASFVTITELYSFAC